ncbi:hypothetical protein EGI26_14010 [Lacihabitans sp. CCS-44]|uniref:hypothetical protein n=1 Tax=Lacihabitans sp. CCS-44 TaxID=2487331 RepID=UPI0020CEEC56|nr:hypothetical protein [Lacihabitans sp. CCS-44]MCP9756274.1 hypothetical protein [Lacihabitans sp. CCS-44]
MVLRFIIGLFLLSNLVFGQKKVCLFSNKSGSQEVKKLLIEKSKVFNINLIEVDRLENLSEFGAIFFLDFDETKLSVKENSILVSFFKNGGGVIGTYDIQGSTSKRIWFEQMFGKVENKMPEKMELDLIPVQDLGEMGLSPLWKMPLVEFVYPTVPKYLKPILMNLEGKAISWYGVSEFANKVYYTSLKIDTQSIHNQDFLKSLFGGVKSVVSTKNEITILQNILPEATDFRVLNIAKGFHQSSVLEYFSSKYCLILTRKGELFNYITLSKELISLGLFDSLKDAVDITADPEFESNGYFYFYFGEDKAVVKRVKMFNPQKAELDDFSLESSFPIKNVFLSKKDSTNVGMPKYYQGKQFSLSKVGEIEVASLNNDQEVIDIEPFVLFEKDDSLQGAAQKENGEMLILMNDSLNLVQYRGEKGFPPFVSFAFKNLSIKPPFKVEFEAIIEEGFDLEWEILGKKQIGKKVAQVFKTVGEYPINLKAFNKNGQSDYMSKTIKIEKASIVK